MKINAFATFFIYGLAFVLLGKWILYDGEMAQLLIPNVKFDGFEIKEVRQEKIGMFISEKLYLNEFIVIKIAYNNGKTKIIRRKIPKHYGTWFREARFIEGGIQLSPPQLFVDLPYVK
jgi:hypothetical protein